MYSLKRSTKLAKFYLGTRRKRRKAQITKIKNEGDNITTHLTKKKHKQQKFFRQINVKNSMAAV
jgi:hypothetical protein